MRAVTLPELPPFCGGAVGYAGYDTVRYFEHLPQRPARRSPRARPGLRLLRPDGGLRQRHQDDRGGGHGPPGKRRGAWAMRRATPKGLRGGLPPRATTWSSSWPRPSSRPASPSTSAPRATVPLAYRSNFTQAAVRGGRPQVRRVHPRRRHFPGRPQPAAGSADAAPIPSRSIARCGWSTPARSCSTCARPA